MSVKCYGSTSVSKTEREGSTPSTDAKIRKRGRVRFKALVLTSKKIRRGGRAVEGASLEN